MSEPQSASGTLTSLQSAAAALLDGLTPVASRLLSLDQALGCVAAQMPPSALAHPARNIALSDGWAFRALDLVGASAYSPVPLPRPPVWVEAGDAMPDGCDCVIDADLVDSVGPLPQVLAEAVPGQGVRRAGEDLKAKSPIAIEGRKLSAIDILAARSMKIGEIAVRRPRVRLIDVSAASGEQATTQFAARMARQSGAEVDIETVARDAVSIAEALDGGGCDLILLVGGTGAGRTDATAAALAAKGALLAHNIALQPGRTAAVGRLHGIPAIALPGSADQAFAAFLALAQPTLDRLCAMPARQGVALPLTRKIASTVGIAEIALLKHERTSWTPLAVGDLPLDAMRQADGWLVIPGDSEGHAAGTPVAASLLCG